MPNLLLRLLLLPINKRFGLLHFMFKVLFQIPQVLIHFADHLSDERVVLDLEWDVVLGFNIELVVGGKLVGVVLEGGFEFNRLHLFAYYLLWLPRTQRSLPHKPHLPLFPITFHKNKKIRIRAFPPLS